MRPERALRVLKVQLVCPKLVEDDVDVLDMLRPRRIVDEISSKNTKTNLCRYRRNTSFITAWNVVGALERPNGMTRNS
jgi:hypothetical protein